MNGGGAQGQGHTTVLIQSLILQVVTVSTQISFPGSDLVTIIDEVRVVPVFYARGTELTDLSPPSH